MTYTITQGVNLHVIETQKYKTIRFFVRFTNRLQKEMMTKRSLLASLMETNSLNYPDQTKLSSQLADLYGASFGMSVGKKGNLHWINLGLHLVNGKYVNDEQLLTKTVAFLKEVLFYPNILQNAWEEKTFELEKENLKSYIENLKEDKQTYATLALQELYFSENEEQGMPSVGTIEALESLTASDLSQYYYQMMKEDKVDIFVIGDIKEADVVELFSSLPFEERELLHPEIFYQQDISNVIKEKQVHEPVVQAKLNLGYATATYFEDIDRFPLMVFNGLFGGFPHSKLFTNVREKESLAYYASSSIDTFRGYMGVQTGIESKHRNRVLHLIAEQLESLRQELVTAAELEQTKAMLRNQYLLSLDNAQSAIEKAYLDAWLPETQLSDEKWLARLENVTAEEVQRMAKKVQLQAIFFLDGVENNG